MNECIGCGKKFDVAKEELKSKTGELCSKCLLEGIEMITETLKSLNFEGKND